MSRRDLDSQIAFGIETEFVIKPRRWSFTQTYAQGPQADRLHRVNDTLQEFARKLRANHNARVRAPLDSAKQMKSLVEVEDPIVSVRYNFWILEEDASITTDTTPPCTLIIRLGGQFYFRCSLETGVIFADA